MPPIILVMMMNKVSNILSPFPIEVENIISRKTRKTQIREISNDMLNKIGAKLTLISIKKMAIK